MKTFYQWLEAMSPGEIETAKAQMAKQTINGRRQQSPEKEQNIRTVEMFLKHYPGITLQDLIQYGRQGSYAVWHFIKFAKAEGFPPSALVHSIIEPYKMHS